MVKKIRWLQKVDSVGGHFVVPNSFENQLQRFVEFGLALNRRQSEYQRHFKKPRAVQKPVL